MKHPVVKGCSKHISCSNISSNQDESQSLEFFSFTRKEGGIDKSEIKRRESESSYITNSEVVKIESMMLNMAVGNYDPTKSFVNNTSCTLFNEEGLKKKKPTGNNRCGFTASYNRNVCEERNSSNALKTESTMHELFTEDNLKNRLGIEYNINPNSNNLKQIDEVNTYRFKSLDYDQSNNLETKIRNSRNTKCELPMNSGREFINRSCHFEERKDKLLKSMLMKSPKVIETETFVEGGTRRSDALRMCGNCNILINTVKQLNDTIEMKNSEISQLMFEKEKLLELIRNLSMRITNVTPSLSPNIGSGCISVNFNNNNFNNSRQEVQSFDQDDLIFHSSSKPIGNCNNFSQELSNGNISREQNSVYKKAAKQNAIYSSKIRIHKSISGTRNHPSYVECMSNQSIPKVNLTHISKDQNKSLSSFIINQEISSVRSGNPYAADQTSLSHQIDKIKTVSNLKKASVKPKVNPINIPSSTQQVLAEETLQNEDRRLNKNSRIPKSKRMQTKEMLVQMTTEDRIHENEIPQYFKITTK